jgi:palmitoyl-protein thioesterase
MLHKHTNFNLFVLLIATSFYTTLSSQNLPIVLLHGLVEDKCSMIPAQEHIKKYMPDVYVKNINLGEGKITSLFNMYDQVEYLKEALQADENLQDGCIFIAHSQGALTARYFIQKYNNPRVYVYIAWGGPECGIYGAPDKLDKYFAWLNYIEHYSYTFAYSYLMQHFVSFAGYWKDPLHYQEYLNGNIFLPYLNNEITHQDNDLFKENISNLATMVLVQSTEDEVVVPRASCHFGFYDIGSLTHITSLYDSPLYQDDLLGLKTLDESGRLHLLFAHCSHSELQSDEYNFINNTLPYLTYETP